MTTQHLLYIPTIFLLGFVFGTLANEKKSRSGSMPAMSSDNLVPYKISAKKLSLTFLIFLLVFVITHVFDIPWGVKYVSQKLGGLNVFDKHPVFSGTEVYERIKLFPKEGVLAYKRFTYTVDILFPFSFFIFLFTYARFVYERKILSKYLAIILIGLPVVWFALDLIENTVIFSVLSVLPGQFHFLTGSLGFITAAKFSLLLLSILTPSLLLIFAKQNLKVGQKIIT